MNLPQIPSPFQPVSSNDKFFAVASHLCIFVGFVFILPLIVYLVKRGESDWVATHAREALNFHISLLLYSLCAFPLLFILIGIPIYIALSILSVVCAIVAAVKASEGKFYRYPLTIPFIS